METTISKAVKHQALLDVLRGVANINLGNKNVQSAQNSLIDPSMSTTGDFAVNGIVVTRTASSSIFVITPDTTIPIGAGAAFVCCLNAAGSVSHVAGSSSFSLVDSAAGSHLFTQRLNMNSL